MSESGLQRNLSFYGIIAIATGSVLGGWLAEAPYWFQLTGAGAALLFPVIALFLLPAGLAFAELTSMLPFASSVDVWSTNAINAKAGWGTQWLYFLVNVVEPPLVAFIFVTAVEFYVNIPSSLEAPIAIALIVVWFAVSNFDIELTGTLAIVFFVVMLLMTLAVSFYFYLSGHWELVNITQSGGFFPEGITGAIVGMSALVLKYIGFGMTPTMIQETNFPTKRMGTVIIAALFVPAVVYFFAILAMGGLAPYTVIADMSLPAPELVNRLDMLGIIATLAIIAGVLYAFTTLMGFWTASARVLYGASQLNQLPDWFTRTNSHGQPYLANIVVLGFGVFFSLFTGANWVQYIYSLSVVAAGGVYFMVCLDAYLLRNKHPEWERPYQAYGGKLTFVIGMFVSAGVAIAGATELPPRALFPLAVYLAFGIIIYYAMKYYRNEIDEDYSPVVLTANDKDKVGTIEIE